MKKSNNPTKIIFACLLGIFFAFACSNSRLGGDWLIPTNQLSEGEGDGDIPAINNPKFTKASQINFLTDSSIIIGIKIGDKINAYPLEIMDWHEVVNDLIDSLPIALTYSSLSGSSIAFNRKIKEKVIEFRVSGILFNSNTIFSEFDTFTDWLQFQRRGVRGNFSDEKLSSFPVFEMNWAKWKQLFPNSNVLNYNTSYNRPYGIYPYSDYRTDSTKIFFNLPLNIDSLNNVLFLKEKILGVNIDGIVKGYRLKSFPTTGFSIIEDEINREPIVIIGSREYQFMVAYSRKTNNNNLLNFTPINDINNIQLLDNQGNKWTIFGESTENSSIRLNQVESNIAYWFTWATFYPEIEIYN